MLNDLHKIGIKFYTDGGDDVPLTDFIPVFHRWIQQGSLDGTLVDVADYSHVPAGPGTMLIAHDGNYAIDETGNRRGILYYCKLEIQGERLEDRLAAVCRRNLAACRLLEADGDTGDRVRFDYGRMEIIANDRLHAPNSEETWTAFEPVLQAFLGRLYPGNGYQVERNGDDERERFSVRVIMEDKAAKAEELLARL
ncbi:MAG: hypothetical protein P8126_04045 [Gammaproteobacteria bacterium]|jgi:hypothetical protein